MHHSGLIFEPVFDYEQVLVVPGNHRLAGADHVQPQDLQGETLITYPVPTERLDIFTQFLLPAGMAPRAHKSIETTDIMLQMVASGRGVAALPRWLVLEYAQRLDIRPLRLGKEGIAKQIHLGLRAEDLQRDYLTDFMKMAQAPESLS
jgi:LysR family transcriptional regulator for metE and metH